MAKVFEIHLLESLARWHADKIKNLYQTTGKYCCCFSKVAKDFPPSSGLMGNSIINCYIFGYKTGFYAPDFKIGWIGYTLWNPWWYSASFFRFLVFVYSTPLVFLRVIKTQSLTCYARKVFTERSPLFWSYKPLGVCFCWILHIYHSPIRRIRLRG